MVCEEEAVAAGLSSTSMGGQPFERLYCNDEEDML